MEFSLKNCEIEILRTEKASNGEWESYGTEKEAWIGGHKVSQTHTPFSGGWFVGLKSWQE